MTSAVLVALLCVAACGGADGSLSPDRGTQPTTIETPATLVGEFEITVEEGPVGDDELSEVNFGSLTTDDGVVLVEVWADVVRAAGLSRDELVAGGRYRVELAGESEYAADGFPSYVVAALQPDG